MSTLWHWWQHLTFSHAALVMCALASVATLWACHWEDRKWRK